MRKLLCSFEVLFCFCLEVKRDLANSNNLQYAWNLKLNYVFVTGGEVFMT